MASSTVSRAACLLHRATKNVAEKQMQNLIRQTLRQKHIWTRRSTSSIAYKVPVKENPKTLEDDAEISYQFQQVSTPEFDHTFSELPISTETKFKGLDTDFPCMTKNKTSGPEPTYDNIASGYKVFHYEHPFHLRYGILPELNIAYETWGELNENKDNVVLISTGLSASSHARSHEENTAPGWWEKFVGPGCAVDTDHFFVICTNHLGGCYGSTGPSSQNPITGRPYGTTFPMITVEDMIRAQFLLLESLGIHKLYASVGSSLGGMLSVGAAVLFPDKVERAVTISSAARSHPSSIAMRYLQRKAIMLDPAWHKGHYYLGQHYPKLGMKLAREIATVTYRSGEEWDGRFGRARINDDAEPSLCPYFMIENYLDHQGEMFSTKYDPNSLLYISKAMDMFDIGETFGSLVDAFKRVECPVLVIGVHSDILFPIAQQREIARNLQEAGNEAVTYYELNSIYGHDTFMLDLNTVGVGIKGFLETDNKNKGRAGKKQVKSSS